MTETSFSRASASSHLGFLRFLLRRMAELRISQVAASLTFTTLLALVPLLTVTLIVISAFPVFSDYSVRFKVLLLTTLVPEFAGKVITVYMRQFTENASSLTAAGIAMLGASALMLMVTIERTFNGIWRVERSRPFLQQMLVYWTVLTLGPLLLGVGLSSWNWLYKTSGLKHSHPVVALTIQIIGSIGLTTLVLWFLYRLVPNRFVPADQAAIGAFVTALLLEVTKRAFGYYITEMASYQLVYGAFASVPIFLLWVFCLWFVVLAGAMFTASLSYWEGGAWRRNFDLRRRFQDAVEALLMLHQAQSEGCALRLTDLRREIRVGYDELGQLLDELTRLQYVQLGADGWVLKRRAESIQLVDLFRQFVYKSTPDQDDEVAEALEALLSPAFNSLDMTLDEFARRLGRK
ncbi:YihY family inner membrane protein [Crenobacter sp. SG2303]|uniref:UPF0761 membrane protein QU481_07810 n=1 Tax=Crenobacter oryzisoli TaxID=3056844 RepID=A0ABT7XLZ4_9NEIS|nr:YihY family inner membrane protein [Crenobacter sp. SG2303]MDN0074797.1 YihY family inner membrane protein [Crenobacter sp. SG2303]